MGANHSILRISISDEDRRIIQEETGVPYVTPEIEVHWDDSPGDAYLCVQNMHGFNDRDIKWYITELAKCESESVASVAKRILTIADGFVSFHTPHLPGHTRLYVDG